MVPLRARHSSSMARTAPLNWVAGADTPSPMLHAKTMSPVRLQQHKSSSTWHSPSITMNSQVQCKHADTLLWTHNHNQCTTHHGMHKLPCPLLSFLRGHCCVSRLSSSLSANAFQLRPQWAAATDTLEGSKGQRYMLAAASNHIPMRMLRSSCGCTNMHTLYMHVDMGV